MNITPHLSADSGLSRCGNGKQHQTPSLIHFWNCVFFFFQIQSALSIAFFCVALHPAAQKRAQDEIDRVVGTERLPTFEDRASLPYVEALWRETLRWRPALPVGNAHATIADDEYNGYFFPKGKS